MIDKTVPNVTFHYRVRDESVGGDNPFVWKDVTTDDLFKGKKVLIFSLPRRLHQLVPQCKFQGLNKCMTNW